MQLSCLNLKLSIQRFFFVNIGTHGVIILNVTQNESVTKGAVDVQH